MTTVDNTVYPQVCVDHNHGICVLKDARVVLDSGRYPRIVGTVVEGGNMNRLFSATSYTPFTPGTETGYYIGSSRVYPDATYGHRVNACFCG